MSNKKLTPEEIAALSESLGKCINPTTGEPVTARRDDAAVLPNPDTVTGSADGNGRGTCPHCGAHVRLSSKGYVTSHSVRSHPLPVPPPKVRLAERQAEVTDTGARVGSPDAAMRTRDAEIRAASGTATVTIKVVNDEGKLEPQEVPATAANIRTALRQEQKRKSPDAKLLAKLGSMLRGATGTVAVPVIGAEPGTYKVREAVTLDAPHAPEGREERSRDGRNGHVATSPGPALVNGRPMSGAVPEAKDRETSKGKPRNAIGWSGPLGRQRPDTVALVGNVEACKGNGAGKSCDVIACAAIVGGRHGYMPCCVYRTRSKAQKRRYWQHVATAEKRAKHAAELSRRVVDMPHKQWPTSRSTMGGPAIRQA